MIEIPLEIEREMDPYQILEISYFATEKEIQQAFQTKLKSATDPDLLMKAYGMIRDSNSRESFLWSNLRSLLLNPLEGKNERVDIQALAKELAFLSPWELGEDESCQM